MMIHSGATLIDGDDDDDDITRYNWLLFPFSERKMLEFNCERRKGWDSNVF
jgi:hypothetical protein